MALEIERKFLVKSEAWRDRVERSEAFRQGNLAQAERLSVRVRCSSTQAWLNIKGGGIAATRDEYEYCVPLADARELLDRYCRRPLIEKTRYWVPVGAHTWEIDVFEGDNAGLVVAEIELDAEDEDFERPDWLGAEVTRDARYYNIHLVTHPYSEWGDE